MAEGEDELDVALRAKKRRQSNSRWKGNNLAKVIIGNSRMYKGILECYAFEVALECWYDIGSVENGEVIEATPAM